VIGITRAIAEERIRAPSQLDEPHEVGSSAIVTRRKNGGKNQIPASRCSGYPYGVPWKTPKLKYNN